MITYIRLRIANHAQSQFTLEMSKLLFPLQERSICSRYDLTQCLTEQENFIVCIHWFYESSQSDKGHWEPERKDLLEKLFHEITFKDDILEMRTYDILESHR
ncbi:hypothetical protein J8281_06425 [Aquimarina sp. U1-2]|uniref:hypothetical protein n=1 Tax=Aquimarina sp. U1-2 TaxID=2823141 RepID=UPI001AECD46C|nr:hypothetical protein [Aquimarina sp. U1-2]MBP2831820.1 hypothetical protein [Aquimarina sp. U1-2]